MPRRFLFALFLLVPLLVPTIAAAASVSSFLPIVQCGGTDYSGQPQKPCGPCDLFDAADNFANFILQGVTGPVAAFMFVIGGGMLLVGAGNTNLQAQGKRLLTNTAIGVVIVLLAWVFTNFLIKAVAGGSAGDAWYQFSCPAFLGPNSIPLNTDGNPPAVPPIGAVAPAPQNYSVDTSKLTQADFQQYAKDHNNALVPAGNSSQLTSLISCIKNSKIIVALANDPADWFTFERDKPVCNYTRGEQIGAGACAHDVNSCHYGGTAGKGAMAVDIGPHGGTVDVGIKDQKTGQPVPVLADLGTLYCQMYDYLVTKKSCGDIKLLNWEPEKNHLHISTASCDTDGKTLNTAASSKKANQPVPSCANGFRSPK